MGAGEISHEARIDHGVAWDAGTTYHYTLAWGPNGRVVLSRGQNVIYDYDHGAPVRLRYLLIGRDREGKPNYGEQPGVIYSNVQVWVEGAPVLRPMRADTMPAAATSPKRRWGEGAGVGERLRRRWP